VAEANEKPDGDNETDYACGAESTHLCPTPAVDWRQLSVARAASELAIRASRRLRCVVVSRVSRR